MYLSSNSDYKKKNAISLKQSVHRKTKSKLWSDYNGMEVARLSYES